MWSTGTQNKTRGLSIRSRSRGSKRKYAREGKKYSQNIFDIKRELSAELMQRQRKALPTWETQNKLLKAASIKLQELPAKLCQGLQELIRKIKSLQRSVRFISNTN